ncbi:MAG: asparagine synthase (glutamine-hydrolyzing) [Phycisphaerae bacterium]|nr:asparagine synthase (glutamine-hydrolyzing) [Phycisphaerae bacterium]
MCGIAGTIRWDGQPVERDRLTVACASLRHRGPDDSDTWVSQAREVGLGAVRLAVLDPSPAGRQPMHDPSRRFHLAYNGELYNFREIRQALIQEGVTFRTETDTEVILAAISRWGPESLLRFDGMWALAFYDSLERCGFLARDFFGIKPLVYAEVGECLHFASELDALRELTSVDGEIDQHALREHLQYGFIAAPRTIFRQARRLPPGFVLEFDHRGAKVPRRYFDPVSNRRTDIAEDYGDARAAVRQLITESVIRRRVSDVPIGAFLSGGLDSSIVAWHLAKSVGRPIATFCIGYADGAAYDESPAARSIARWIGTNHHEIMLSHGEVLAAIPPLLDHLGEPVGDSSIIPTSMVSRFAREHVTVALSGDAGDELFGGYWRYTAHAALEAWQRWPGWIRRGLIEPIMRRGGTSRSSAWQNRARQLHKLLRGAGKGWLDRHLQWSRIMSPEAERVFSNGVAAGDLDAEIAESVAPIVAPMPREDPLNAIFALDLQHQLPSDMLQKVDLASMMHSLEVRVPFLDDRLVALALGLPSGWKVRGGLRKQILIDAYRGHLPDEVLDRPKRGFEVPVGEYLRGPLREMFESVVTRETVESLGVVDHAGVQRVYGDHLGRRGDHAELLWALLSLCWWRSRKLGRQRAS